MSIRLVTIIAVSVLTISCARSESPTEPSTALTEPGTPVTVPALPMLLFGQSNAVILRDLAVPQSINVVQGGTGIAAWGADRPLGIELRTNAATRSPFCVLTVWQGEHDGTMTTAEYAAVLRAIIADVRARGGATLPVRIVEIADEPSLATVRAAHRLVAADPGNALIETADLQRDGVHFVPGAYTIVAERIYRSLE
jgi:hypothetical protein